MQNHTMISKWGNSLAVRIPLALAKQAGLTEGDSVAVALEPDGAIVLRATRKRYDLAELVGQITRKNRHKETGWGKPQGKEAW